MILDLKKHEERLKHLQSQSDRISTDIKLAEEFLKKTGCGLEVLQISENNLLLWKDGRICFSCSIEDEKFPLEECPLKIKRQAHPFLLELVGLCMEQMEECMGEED